MMTYITAFIFYTLAMIGILLVGFVIYKKTFVINKGENKGMIKILDSYPIGPKKTLLVVRIKNEKFLIASGAEHTTFLSKLSDENTKSQALEKNSQPRMKKQQLPDMTQEELESAILDENKIKQQRYDDTQIYQSRLDKIQKQFNELYEKEDEPSENVQNASDRRQMIRRLLKDLNETNSVKSGRM